MLAAQLGQEDLEILTDAFVLKAKLRFEETEEERLRAVVQQVIVDTWLTAEGVVSIEKWAEHD